MLMRIKRNQRSLSPEDKDLFEKNHTAAQHKYCKSLSPDQKAQVNTKDAAEHKKHQEFLSYEQKGQTKSIDATAHKRKYELLPPDKKARLMETITEQRHEHLTEEEKKISAQIRSVAGTLYKILIWINQLLSFYVNIFTRIQHWHWLIFIVVQQILVWQYSMMNYNQMLINQSYGIAFQT
jgi:hypothetical protein